MKNMKQLFNIRYAVLLLSLMSMTPSQAEDWEHILSSKEAKIYVDLDSYQEIQGYPAIITKTQYSQPRSLKLDASKRYDTELNTLAFNCQTHEIKQIESNILALGSKETSKKVIAKLGEKPFVSSLSNHNDSQIEQLVCQVKRMVSG
jgi:hypothetical protein